MEVGSKETMVYPVSLEPKALQPGEIESGNFDWLTGGGSRRHCFLVKYSVQSMEME